MDAATRARVQAGCNFVNGEIARLRKKVTMITIAALGGGLILWMFMGGPDPRLPLFGALAVSAFFANRARLELKNSYKGVVVRRMVAALGKGLSYSASSSITRDTFEGMDLFSERGDKFESEDQVTGRKGEVPFALHEVRVRRREKSSRNRVMFGGGGAQLIAIGIDALGSRTLNKGNYIFSGLVVQLDFNKNFRGHTVVVPDTEAKILGGLFGESETRKSKAIVRLENPDFEGQFAVYSSDDQEARYLITPKLMELILEAQALLGSRLRLCFMSSNLWVTVPQDKDRFDVGLFSGTVTPESVLGDFIEVVALAERLVDTLDLETRIWSKA
jgi:hypothetical protein